MFTADEIQKRIRETPFVPVRVVTTTGQTYDIYHPDLIMIGQRSLMIGLPSTRDPSIYSQVTRVAILHVTELQDSPMPTQQGGNGEG